MLQRFFATFHCLLELWDYLQTPNLSIPSFCIPIASSAFLFLLFLSLFSAEWSSICQRILRCGHTILFFFIFTIFSWTCHKFMSQSHHLLLSRSTYYLIPFLYRWLFADNEVRTWKFSTPNKVLRHFGWLLSMTRLTAVRNIFKHGVR